MIDVHCHLVDNKFNEDIDDVIKQAQSLGIEKIINVPEFESQFEKSIEITKKYNEYVYTGIGIHPIQKKGKPAKMKHVAKMEQFLVEHEKEIICVGECGLDHTTTQFKLTEADFEEQERVFKMQIDLAKQYDKPLNVHSRSAARRTIEILRECQVPADRAVLHAFDGTLEEAKMGLAAGYLFSVPPSFAKNSKAEFIAAIPLHRLLLETDSPALGPEKGVKNVPSNLTIVADFIAKVKNAPLDDVISITKLNSSRIFVF